jgi:hypothetical protein
MSSGATSSAGRAKKDWGRCWEGVVARGVALGMGGKLWRGQKGIKTEKTCKRCEAMTILL